MKIQKQQMEVAVTELEEKISNLVKDIADKEKKSKDINAQCEESRT